MKKEEKMRFNFKFFLIVVLFVILINLASAANHYVRADAAGANNGSDWTNAYTSLPTTPVRNDTYYVADGNYSGDYNANTADSGTLLITFKKAIGSDHGTDTGWDSSYGDGVALFTGHFTFYSDYWIFDGQTGGNPVAGNMSSWTTGHGFKFTADGVVINLNSYDHIQFSHSEFAGNCGMSNCTGMAFYSVVGQPPPMPADYITISHDYIHNYVVDFKTEASPKNWTIEYSYVDWNGPYSEHKEAWAEDGDDYVTLRYNYFTRIAGSSLLSNLYTSSEEHWDVYGNVFYNPDTCGNISWGLGDATLNFAVGAVNDNIRVYQNTFVGTTGLSMITGGGTVNLLSYNNLFYNNLAQYMMPSGGGWTQDYSWGYNSIDHFHGCNPTGYDLTDAHVQFGTGDPFTNSSNGDFELAAHTNSGMNLGAPYNVDVYGNVRTNWDRGAYEYVSGATPNVTTTLNSPANGVSTNNTTNIIFNCSASDSGGNGLTNMTLYGNWTGSWIANETKTITGTSNSTTFIKNLTSGNYIWNCLAYDNITNSAWASSNYTFTVDTTPPSINITSPANNSNSYNTNLNVNYVVSDNAAIGSCWYSNDSYSVNTSLANCVNITTVTWTIGQHNVTVWLNDTAGNQNYSRVSFTILLDSVYPVFYNITDNNGSLLDSGIVTISANINSTNGTAGVQFGGTNYSMSNSSNYFNVSFSRSGGGTYSYYIWSYGNGSGNNFNITAARSYTVNATPASSPNINFTAPTPANGTSTTNTSIPINVSISTSSSSNLNSLIYNWNGANYTMYNNSLVLMLNFDNVSSLGEGTSDNKTVDVSGYGNNGTIINMKEIGGNYTTGKYGNGLSFDGSNDYVQIPDSDSLDITTSFTISFWVKYDYNLGDVDMNRLISKWDDHTGQRSYQMWIDKSGGHVGVAHELALEVTGGYVGTGYIVPNNAWKYLTWTHSPVGDVFYVDSVAKYTGDLTDPSKTTANLTIATDDALINHFGGIIDELSIWNRTLSAAEVAQQYMSNLQKYNQTQWYLYVNQSKNSTAGLDNGTYTYQTFVNDSSGNTNQTEQRSVTIGTPDTVYPTFSTYWDNNASLNGSGTGIFNVTLSNTNGSVLLEINEVNITAKNITDNIFNATYTFSSGGTYSYHWDSWGNGTNNNFNVSDTRSYTVNSSGVLCASNTYYIDYASGNDSNNGTCSNSAWKHSPGDSAATGNAASVQLQPGDTVLFRAGISYQGIIYIPASGNSSSPITYLGTGWGTGTAIIDEANTTSLGIRAITKSYIIIDGFELKSFSKAVSSNAIYFTGGSNNIIRNNYIHDVYYTSNPNPGDSSWELQNGIGINIAGSNYTKVYNNTVRDVGNCAIELGNSAGVTTYGYEAYGNDLQNMGNGMRVTVDDTLVGGGLRNIKVHNNYIHDFGNYTGSIAWHHDGIHAWAGPNTASATIENLEIYDNYFVNVNPGDTPSTAWVYLEFAVKNASIHHNIMQDPSGWYALVFIGQLLNNASFVVDSNDTVYNNIFYTTTAGVGRAVDIEDNTGVKMRNNIFYTIELPYTTLANSMQGFDSDYNTFYVSGQAEGSTNVVALNGTNQDGTGATFFTLPSLKASSSYILERHSIYGQPLFTSNPEGVSNPAAFIPVLGSIVINSGQDLGSAFSTDYAGNTHGNGGAWDIGAYEYTGTDVYPASILSYPANGNITNLGVVTFQCNATDDYNLKNVTLYVWNSSNGLITTNSTSFSGTSNSTTFTYNFTFYNSTTWNCLVYDNASQGDWGTNRTLIISAPDNSYPQFSTYWDNNGTLIDSGVGLFNVTLLNTNGTVFLEINGQNITAKNLTDNIFNATYTFSSAGTYSYKWYSWGNGSLNNFNKSDTRSYTVNATPIGINFTSPTPGNGASTSNSSILINVSIVGGNLGEVKFNWNGVNYSVFNNNTLLFMNFDNVSNLGENNTYVADLSGKGNNGVVLNNPNWTSNGKYHGAFNFNGINSKIQVLHNNNQRISNYGTWSFWVNMSEVSSCQTFVSKRDNWDTNNAWAMGIGFDVGNATGIGFESSIDGTANAGKKSNNYWNNASINLNQWNMITFVYNSSDTTRNVRLYINAIEINPLQEQNLNNSIYSSTSSIYIGAVNNGDACMLNGTLDELMISNNSLTQSEILEMYFANLYKYDINKWDLFINQSKNVTAGLDIGTYTYQAFVNDSSGNTNQTEQRSVTITSGDTTPPNISIIYPSNNTNWSYKTINVNYTVSDNINVSSCWYSNDSAKHNTTLSNCANITGVTWLEGINNVTIWTNDTSGNVNSTSVRFTVDTTPPYFTNLANQSLLAGQSLSYDINAADAGAGLGIFAINWTNTFSINSSTGVLTNSSALSIGNYLINVSVNDSLGNLNSSVLFINVTNIPDTINPQISIVYPSNNTNTSNVNLDVNYTYGDNYGIGSCWYSNDSMGVNYSLGGDGSCANIVNITWSNGPHNVTVYVNDTSNNLNWSRVSFFVDNVVPNVNLVSPSDSSTWSSSGTVTFTYNVTDNGNIANCSLIINNAVDQTATTITESTSQTFTKSMSNAAYNWNVNCTDASNNQGNSSVYSLTVSYTAPSSGGTGGGGGGGGGTPIVNNTNTNATQPGTNNTVTTNVTNISAPANAAGNKSLYSTIAVWVLVAVVVGAAILVGSLLIRKLKKAKAPLPNVK